MPVDVEPPAEEMFHEPAKAALVADQEEEEIRVVLAVEEGGLGEYIEHGPDPLRPFFFKGQGQKLRRRAGPLVRHVPPPSSRRN